MPVGRVVVAGFFVVAVLIFSSPGAFAQGQTGTIAGVVRDSSGAVLPGVTVEASSPALIEKAHRGHRRTRAIQDHRSAARHLRRRFSLPGFATVRREEIVLTAAFTANVNADMKVGALEETVTVSGDPRSSTRRTSPRSPPPRAR